MKHIIIRLAAVVVIALSIAGCALSDRIGSVYTAVTSTTVSPDAVVYAASAFDAVEITATNYLRFRRCNGTNGPICRDPALRIQIVDAVHAGRDARNKLKIFLRTHPGELGPQGSYDALIAATGTLKNLLSVYKSAGG